MTTPQDRMAISRRLIQIPKEVSMLLETITNVTSNGNDLSAIDSVNQGLLSDAITTTDPLLTTRAALQNIPVNTFAFADVIQTSPSYKIDPNGWFYPTSPPYVYSIPQLNIHSAGFNSGWITSPWCEEWISKTYQFLCKSILNGWGGGGGDITTTFTGIISNVMTVASTTGMAVGNLLLVTGNNHTPPPATTQNIYYIVEIIDARSVFVLPLGSETVEPTGATVHVRGAANWPWNNNFPTLTYLAAESAISSWMDTHASTTSTYYSAIQPELGTTWLTDPNRFRNTALTTLLNSCNSWVTAVNNEIALFGSVTDNGDGTFSNPLGAIGNRYVLLNAVIGKSGGSSFQSQNTAKANTTIQQQVQNLIALFDNYSATMMAIPLIADADGSQRINLNAYRRSVTIYPTGYPSTPPYIINQAPPRPNYLCNLHPGDQIYIYAEGQTDEINTTVLNISPQGVLDVADPVPTTFTTASNARIYKTPIPYIAHM